MYPHWSSNGRELFFRNGTKMMVVEVDSSERDLTLGSEQMLFDGEYRSGERREQRAQDRRVAGEAERDGGHLAVRPNARLEDGDELRLTLHRALGQVDLVCNFRPRVNLPFLTFRRLALNPFNYIVNELRRYPPTPRILFYKYFQGGPQDPQIEST